MKVIEKTQVGKTQKYLLSMPAKELRFLTALITGAIDLRGAEKLASATPVSSNTIMKLERQLQNALAGDAQPPNS